jgi:hypothetical protein
MMDMKTRMQMNIQQKIIFGIKIFFGILLFLIAFGFITMLLWNWLVPVLFSGPVITFWQALGLLALCKILFGSSGGFKGRGRCGRRSRWREKMEERLQNMSPEEKEKWRNKCCGGPDATTANS